MFFPGHAQCRVSFCFSGRTYLCLSIPFPICVCQQCACDARYRIIAWTAPGARTIERRSSSLQSTGFLTVCPQDTSSLVTRRTRLPTVCSSRTPGSTCPLASQDAYNYYYQSQCRMAIEQSFGIMVSRASLPAFGGVEIKRCNPIGRGVVAVQSILTYGGGLHKALRTAHNAVLEP